SSRGDGITAPGRTTKPERIGAVAPDAEPFDCTKRCLRWLPVVKGRGYGEKAQGGCCFGCDGGSLPLARRCGARAGYGWDHGALRECAAHGPQIFFLSGPPSGDARLSGGPRHLRAER